jgi:MFS family permease
VIRRRTVVALGLSQLISWGVTYYLIGGFGEKISSDLGWSRDIVYGGFTISLLVMGLASPIVGRLVDRRGGRTTMIMGSVVNAIGCIGLALSYRVEEYFAAWTVLGLGMRLTLYDAAFAALARIGGPEARCSMSQITLMGGLGVSVFWPLGHILCEHFGWRTALVGYAGCAILTIPLNLAIPDSRYEGSSVTNSGAPAQSLPASRREIVIRGCLYGMITTGVNFLNVGWSAHMIRVLTGAGLSAAAAVWIAALLGLGQSAARLCEIVFGGRLDPLALNLLACGLMPISFGAGLFSRSSEQLGMTFALLYGACNGILAITRGTLPLVLFDYRSYGALVGISIVPSFVVSAAAPLIYGVFIDCFGSEGAFRLSIGIALVTLLAAWILKRTFPRVRPGRVANRE